METASKDKVQRIRIDESAIDQRIDNFLARICKGVPKSHLYRVLRSGEVRVNGGRIDAAYRLKDGDVVRVPPMRVAERNATATPPVGRGFHILYEDDALLAINKEAGMAVHGGSGISFGVIERLRAARPGAKMLELVHRLDRETSGVLLVAKKRSALVALHESMREGQSAKVYLALVKGRWTKESVDIRLPLHKYVTSDGERRVVVSADGKVSHSRVNLLSRWVSSSLVEVELHTGRTHQIRVHLSHSGYPIAGDDKYGDFTLNRALVGQGLRRMFLHAWKLGIDHPVTGHRLELAAPLPEELVAWIAQLNNTENKDRGSTF